MQRVQEINLTILITAGVALQVLVFFGRADIGTPLFLLALISVAYLRHKDFKCSNCSYRYSIWSNNKHPDICPRCKVPWNRKI